MESSVQSMKRFSKADHRSSLPSFLTSILMICLIIPNLTNCTGKAQSAGQKKPAVALMLWDEKAREGSDFGEFQIYYEGERNSKVTVFYTISGTAKNGYDYTPIADTVVVGKGKSIMIQAIDDDLSEGDETVVITLKSHASYEINPKHTSKTLIIQDNEIPDVQFLKPSSKGTESVSTVNIEVTLSKPAEKEVKVDYSTRGIGANEDEDFVLPSGTLTIPAGKLTRTIPVLIKSNNVPEDDKTVIVTLSNPDGANIGLNEKHFYTILNDDGDVQRSSIYDRIYGVIIGTRAASSMGAVVEMVVDPVQIGKIFGTFDEFIPYVHYNVPWTRPAGGTEDGVERQKLIATTIIEKQDNITAQDLLKVWVRDCKLEDMHFMTQPYDRTLLLYAKWGLTPDDMPKSVYGMPGDLGRNIHLTARVFHPLPCINAGDPEGVIRDMRELGNLYYDNKEDEAFAWGSVYNAALTLAMLPGATVNSVIGDALKYASPEIRREIEQGIAIAGKYKDNPMDPAFWKELNAMYADPSSRYCVDKRIERYPQSSIFENVTCAFAMLKATDGNVKQAVVISCNRGRDTDCTAASAAGLAGALTGTETIPEEWIATLEKGTERNPYTNSHMTNRATAQGLYRALQAKLSKMSAELESAKLANGGNLPAGSEKKVAYLELMKKSGVSF